MQWIRYILFLCLAMQASVCFAELPTTQSGSEYNQPSAECRSSFAQLGDGEQTYKKQTYKGISSGNHAENILRRYGSSVGNKQSGADAVEQAWQSARQVLEEDSIKLVGNGGFATVFVGTLKGTTKRVAVKFAKGKNDGGLVREYRLFWYIHNAKDHKGEKHVVNVHHLVTPEGHTAELREGESIVDTTDVHVSPASSGAVGRWGLAMEVADRSFQDLLESGNINGKQILYTTIHTALALETIHLEGFTHLDIKPGNVLMFGDRAKVSDSGIAIQSGSEHGQPKGTLPFMSANQAKPLIDRLQDIRTESKQETMDADGLARTQTAEPQSPSHGEAKKESPPALALASDDYFALGKTLEVSLSHWAFGFDLDRLPNDYGINVKIQLENGKPIEFMTNGEPIWDLYQRIGGRPLNPKDKKLFRMLSEVAWAKNYYKQTDGTNRWNETSQFRFIISKVEQINRENGTLEDFYRHFNRYVLSFLPAEDAARLRYSSSGLTEAARKGWLPTTPSTESAILKAGRNLPTEPPKSVEFGEHVRPTYINSSNLPGSR